MCAREGTVHFPLLGFTCTAFGVSVCYNVRLTNAIKIDFSNIRHEEEGSRDLSVTFPWQIEKATLSEPNNLHTAMIHSAQFAKLFLPNNCLSWTVITAPSDDKRNRKSQIPSKFQVKSSWQAHCSTAVFIHDAPPCPGNFYLWQMEMKDLPVIRLMGEDTSCNLFRVLLEVQSGATSWSHWLAHHSHQQRLVLPHRILPALEFFLHFLSNWEVFLRRTNSPFPHATRPFLHTAGDCFIVWNVSRGFSGWTVLLISGTCCNKMTQIRDLSMGVCFAGSPVCAGKVSNHGFKSRRKLGEELFASKTPRVTVSLGDWGNQEPLDRAVLRRSKNRQRQRRCVAWSSCSWFLTVLLRASCWSEAVSFCETASVSFPPEMWWDFMWDLTPLMCAKVFLQSSQLSSFSPEWPTTGQEITKARQATQKK